MGDETRAVERASGMKDLYEHMVFRGGGVITLVGAGGKTTLMFRLAP